MNMLRHLIVPLAVLLSPLWGLSVEILEADPTLSARIAGDPRVNVSFGTPWYHGLHAGTYMLGTFYQPESREANTVLGFRLTQHFLDEWEEQGEAQLLFSIIEFNAGDPRTICPIQVELLDANHATAMEAACRSEQPRPRLGSILADDLEENRLYNMSLPYQTGLKPGDVVWIGLDCTNPRLPRDQSLILAGDLHLHPGGAPPTLVAGSPDAASHTVHGMSLLQSLNRHFSAPKTTDPSNPQLPERPRWVNPLHTAKKLETLEEFRMTLQQQLSKIPDCPLVATDLYRGFHSSIKSTNETWSLRFPIKNKESSIALYPAVNPNGSTPQPYAFPRRFIIRAIPRSNNQRPVIVADWSHTDFPHDGLMPVIFPIPWDNYNSVHIEVLQGAPMPGGHAFALSEVAFAQLDDTDPVYLRTSSTDTLERPPYWSANYATDGRTPFGRAATPGDTSGTFHIAAQPNDVPQLLLRQAQPTAWNRFEFYPTAFAPGAPPQGFPSGIQIEFSNQNDFSEITRTIRNSSPITVLDATQPYILEFPTVNARNVRITFTPRADKAPSSELQIEEITVNGGFPLLERRKIEIELAHAATGATPHPLIDRVINGYDLHTPLLRRINLIRQDVMTKELTRVENTIDAVLAADRRTLALLESAGIFLLISLFSGILIAQRRHARKTQQNIRLRIQQDLHDEIGSQLSAISLIADLYKNAPDISPTLCTDLTDINQCSREAIASLAEVIWLTDKDILTLDQCFEVMRNRAAQMAHTVQLELDFPQDVPRLRLSYKIKRNLILLFTEALNNALKHAQSDTIRAGAQLNGTELTLYVSDNGKGFSPEKTRGSIGLTSMKDRAAAAKGRLDIESAPDRGTTVRFSGKLKP